MIDTELATFDPNVAEAVVRVLRRQGISAWTTADADERAVHVEPGQRESALSVLADRMEEVNGELADRRPWRNRTTAAAEGDAPDPDDPHSGERPLVMERFRRIGLQLAVLLVPLLVVTLARPPFPLTLAIITLIGGMAVLVYLRDRRARRAEQSRDR